MVQNWCRGRSEIYTPIHLLALELGLPIGCLLLAKRAMSGCDSVSSRHGCISDAYLRRHIQRLRDISKRADLQISETSPKRLIKDVSSKISLRSPRFSQRRL